MKLCEYLVCQNLYLYRVSVKYFLREWNSCELSSAMHVRSMKFENSENSKLVKIAESHNESQW